MAAISDVVFVPYAAEGGKTEALCRESLTLGKRVVTFGGALNAGLLDAGASAIGAAPEMLFMRGKG